MIGSRLAYFVCMILATAIAARLIQHGQMRLRISASQKLGIALGALLGATFAAKLPFLLSAGPDAGVVAAWMSDGKTILWGLVGGYIGVEVAKWSLHIKVATGDTFVLPVAISIAVGRLGCLLYGCCYGVATNQHWGLRFVHAPDHGDLLRHPAQLYELLFHLCFGLLVIGAKQGQSNCLQHRQPIFAAAHGNWMPIYMLAYSAFRFISEYWRPERRDATGLTFYQWSSLAIAMGFITLLLWRSLAQRSQNRSNEVPAT